jgi:hypothetical protein
MGFTMKFIYDNETAVKKEIEKSSIKRQRKEHE